MAKFFRNFRIHSIELNKVKNYMVYAVGEIILVAIGILLALQVGNWREEHTKGETRNAYYKRLLKDLEADTTLISSRLKEWNGELREIAKFVSYSKTEERIDNLLDSLENLSPYAVVLDNFNDDTYESLISYNDINLLSDSTNRLLRTLRNTQAGYLKATEQWSSLLVESFLEKNKYHRPSRLSSISNKRTRDKMYTYESKIKALDRWDFAITLKKGGYLSFISESRVIRDIETQLIIHIKSLQRNDK